MQPPSSDSPLFLAGVGHFAANALIQRGLHHWTQNASCEIHRNLGQGKERHGPHRTSMWISGGLCLMWTLGAGLVAEFAPALWISLLSEPAPLGRSSITPTKTKISPIYPKHGNLWSLRAILLNRSSKSESGNWRQSPGLWLLPHHLGCQGPLSPGPEAPGAASASPMQMGDIPAPSRHVLCPPYRLQPHSSHF